MPKIDIAAIPRRNRTSYPEPWASKMAKRHYQALGDATGLTQFGANLVTLDPGGMSSLRHWHTGEDEFMWMVSGELVLVEEAGETVLKPGDAVGWKAGEANGHHLLNRSGSEASFLVVGTRAERDTCHYPDVDLVAHSDGERGWFTTRDGTHIKDA